MHRTIVVDVIQITRGRSARPSVPTYSIKVPSNQHVAHDANRHLNGGTVMNHGWCESEQQRRLRIFFYI